MESGRVRQQQVRDNRPAPIALWCAALLLAAGAGSEVSTAGTPIVVRVDVASPGARIDRDIFGQFAEHLGTGIYGGVWVGKSSPIPNVRGIRSDVVAALRAIKVPNVRWPGGCFAEEYHWHDGVGPEDKRVVKVNSNWGGVPEPNSFGTDEYMDFLGQIGAEAYISVNVGSGTPAEAAQWLEYMTAEPPATLAMERAANGHPAPYRIKYLGIGNENWGCGGAMSPEHYVEEMKRFSRFARNLNPAQNPASPEIGAPTPVPGAMKRIAVGWDSAKDDYTESILKAWTGKVWSWDIEGVSLHNYALGGWPPRMPSTGFGEDDYARLLEEALRMDALIARQSAMMDGHDPSRKLTLAVDEWGAWLAPLPGTNRGFLQQQNSQRDAILAALTLDIFVRHADRVHLANIAQMVNVLQAMILTDGPRMVLTPTYHVYRMYVPFQDATFVPVQFDAGRYEHGKISIPRLDAIAARDNSGKLWLALTNIDPQQPAEVAVQTTAAALHQAHGEVLAAPRIDAVNSFDTPATVAPRPIKAVRRGDHLVLALPPASVAVLALQP
jgi:alpha-N-arabinofuranosidase